MTLYIYESSIIRLAEDQDAREFHDLIESLVEGVALMMSKGFTLEDIGFESPINQNNKIQVQIYFNAPEEKKSDG